jgi:hypothetical protein
MTIDNLIENIVFIFGIFSSISVLCFFFIGMPIIKWWLRKFIKQVLFDEYCATAEAKKKREAGLKGRN